MTLDKGVELDALAKMALALQRGTVPRYSFFGLVFMFSSRRSSQRLRASFRIADGRSRRQ
ncbi:MULTISPECIES: hypothetical protein [Methylosinus]|uniref:hypothetical protein n=1 Tax=Methylosinus TaxID=425 RepID=UPI000A51E90D|nr:MULTISPECIES: hypothetical protein [Methylosinus]